METGGGEKVKRAADIYLFPPSPSICRDGCGGHAAACVMWGSHGAPEELCPTCISTLVAGKSPARRQEFPGKGYRCQSHSAGIGAGRSRYCSCLLRCSSTGRGDGNPVQRMPSEHRQADSGGRGNISAVDAVSDRVQ